MFLLLLLLLLDIPYSTSESTVVATRCEFANSQFGARVYGTVTSAKFNNCVLRIQRQRI